jgi:TonB-linked SusC/RagA family outer membrane protein
MKIILSIRFIWSQIEVKNIISFMPLLFMVLMFFLSCHVSASDISQPLITITGTITDASNGQALPGVNIYDQNNPTQGTISDLNGKYRINVRDKTSVLIFSYIGFEQSALMVGDNTEINVQLRVSAQELEEIVVVGYGIQKRESVVGAITNTSGETLERRGGVTNLASALSGQLPGVTVLETSGQPGSDPATILIRGKSTWNNAEPLILVDGIERRMHEIDVSEVESVSVLKDASATSVFGVKGANGVILITTKRGKVGQPQLSVSANTGIKTVSKVFGLLDSYEALLWRNQAIENDLPWSTTVWDSYMPYELVSRYKKPQQNPYNYLYPNVDWQDEVLKDYATNHRVNLNIGGGTEIAKYFGSLSYTREDDILSSPYNYERNYDPGFSYDRINYRGNLDFSLTNTTTLSVNLSGYRAETKTNRGNHARIYRAIARQAPNLYPVRYEDGTYGIHPDVLDQSNPIAILNESGTVRRNNTHIGTDFKIGQRLDFITEGLSVAANISYDNYFRTEGPTIQDGFAHGQTRYMHIDPSILTAQTKEDSLAAINYYSSTGTDGKNEFDFVVMPWTIESERVINSNLAQSIFYQVSINYVRSFNKHDITGLALLNRRENVTGPAFPNYREDWVGRLTYAFALKYFFEVNAAYNGSEKFGPGYRFGFFPSAAVGWMLSNEDFLDYDWLNKLKFRGSVGKVGSDAGIPRWGYIGSWSRNGVTPFQTDLGDHVNSPYSHYHEGIIANPYLRWETAIKKNLGLEIDVFQKMLSLEVDLFIDEREGIFLTGDRRSIPASFGASPVPGNIGETVTKGYEIELGFNKRWENSFRIWTKIAMTRAKDKIIFSEDPELLPSYLKREGYQIGQSTSQIRAGMLNDWNDVYASSPFDNNYFKAPGTWDIIDFDGNGIIDAFDEVPFGFPDRPENTYSTTLGSSFKNFSFMVQFYGVTNIHRRVSFPTPSNITGVIVSEYLHDYWTPENTNSYFRHASLASSPSGDFNLFDGSFLRLKTAEIAYTLPKSWLNTIGLANMRIYLNGNNLLFWSDLPHDSETGAYDESNAYPMLRHFNIGINIGF